MKHIGIIGGGFSGTVTAVNLCRLSEGPLKISIINSGYPTARGVAYSTRNGNHLLNVAARNMSALADEPGHFVDWLRTRCEFADEAMPNLRERFIPRRLYGDYISGLLCSQSFVAKQKGIVVETVNQEATDVEMFEDSARIILYNGQSIDVDKVVLATGNPPPTDLRLKGLDPAHPKCIQNPWSNWESKLGDQTENIILIGTGLTAIDVLISLKDLNWKGKIYAISRNGLLPLSHFKGMEYPDWLDAKSGPVKLSAAFRKFKQLYREAQAQGINPVILVDKLRPVTQQLWQGFTLAEKRRFNNHFRTRWNVARHRIAQSIHQQLVEAIAAQRLEIVKGRIQCVAEAGNGLVLTVKTGDRSRRIEGGALINCTGPSESCRHSRSMLYSNLLTRGFINADEMDMGIQVTNDFAVMNKTGEVSKSLFAIGPMLKGSLWETTAVPELRSQTFRLAGILAKEIYGKRAVKLAEAPQVVLEYEI